MAEPNQPLTLSEFKKKLSVKYKGENNPFHGKIHTEETKKKLKEVLTVTKKALVTGI